MNWPLLIVVGIAAVALIVFLAVRNLKDEKNFERQLENDYHKRSSAEGDIEIDEKMK